MIRPSRVPEFSVVEKQARISPLSDHSEISSRDWQEVVVSLTQLYQACAWQADTSKRIRDSVRELLLSLEDT